MLRKRLHLKPALLASGLSLGALMLAPPLAGVSQAAESYPQKPIRLIIPYPPGGATDVIGRIVGKNLSDEIGEQVVIENRGGAGGNIGAGEVARAKPDGYTLVWSVNAPFTLVPFIMKDVPYDAKKDFKPVAWAANAILALAVHPSLPVNNVKELIDYAKAHPGELKFGSAGIGSAHQIAGELIKKNAGIDMVHVPYPGGGPAIADLVGGHIMVSFGTLPAVLPHAQTNALRIIALAEDERYEGLPDVPTISETIPDVGVQTWIGVMAPGGTPRPIVDKLNAAVNAALKDPAVVDLYKKSGVQVRGTSVEELAEVIHKDLAEYEVLFPQIGIEKQ